MDIDRALIDQSLDALDDVFYIYDTHGRLVDWNQRLNDLFGLDDEQLYEMTADEFFLDADRPAVERAVAELFETGETVVEARADTTEGRIRFQLSGRLLTDGGGTPIGFSGIARDVTAKREREERLARQNERLDEFVSIVSHDLRGPLTVLDGSLALAEESGDEAAFERARKTLGRMETLIDDLLTLARKGEWVEEMTPVDLGALARKCWANVDSATATLIVETDRTVMADENRLRQLLENLYQNALEHATEAGDTLTVTVGDFENGFFVADDGPGVPESEREKVFKTGHTSTAGGTGLGLNIVQQIARAHGWSVSIADSADGGARFEVDGARTA